MASLSMKAALCSICLMLATGTNVSAPESNFDSNTMFAMTDFVKAAYCLKGNQWDCADCGKYPDVEFVSIGKGSAITGFVVYGIVAKDPRNKRIVMAFAGSSDIAQWIADVTFILEPVQVAGQNKLVTGLLHGGQYSAWKASRAEWLKAVRQYHSDYPDYEVIVTGHSLGGAMAFLASTDLASEGMRHKVYAFAPNRVGNDVWAKSYLEVQPAKDTFRITHYHDPIPHLPPTAPIPLRHPGIEIHFGKAVLSTSPYRVCQGGVEEPVDTCGANQYQIPVLFIHLFPYHMCYPGQCGTGDAGKAGLPCLDGTKGCGTAFWNGEGLDAAICHSTDPERMDSKMVQV